jgi:LPXTG-site transpeptidase (sortase) family protein
MPMALSQFLGIALLAIGIGGIIGPMTQNIRLETAYLTGQARSAWNSVMTPAKPQLPQSAPVVFEPLTTPDGSSIDPVNNDFALIVPEVGINAAIIPGVNPTSPNEYTEALKKGVAHASTSFFPDQDGTVYLFSHSTNYDWFVSDLNAVFYLLKNLDTNDVVVLIYKGKRYTYKITGKKVVSPSATTYLAPVIGKRNLILQTCWPPGSVAERLLIFADLIEEQGKTI